MSEDVRNYLEQCPLVAIIRGVTPDDAEAIGAALFAAGIRIIEVPLNSPDPLASVRKLAGSLGDRALVGAGTVLDPGEVARVQAAGGRLIVSPNTDPAVIRATVAAGLVSCPGYFTPSEAFTALEAGAHALKFFPAEVATPAVLRAHKAVLPKDVPVIVVGGVTPDSMRSWREAGADAFGLGSGLYKPGQSAAETAGKARAYVAGLRRLMRPLRIAIIGFGKIAADQHVPSIAANPRFELAATSSRSGVGPEPRFTDWRQLLAEVEGLEAVAITTPPSVRCEIARECIERGLHLLLEKPPSDTLSEIEDLACLAEGRAVTLFTTWHAQHNPAVAAAAEALAGKRIAAMDIVWHEDVRKWHPGQRWIWEPGGFGVFDPGINAISIATRIFPGTLFVRRSELHFPEDAQTPIAAEIEFASPVADGPLTCSLDWRRTQGEEWTIVIRTADGTEVRLDNGGSLLSIDGGRRPMEALGEYPDIYRRFAELIDERRSQVDVAPLRLVADCLLVARRHIVGPAPD